MGGTQASLSPSSLPPSRLPFAPDRKGTRTLLLLLHTHTQPMPKKRFTCHTVIMAEGNKERREREGVPSQSTCFTSLKGEEG